MIDCGDHRQLIGIVNYFVSAYPASSSFQKGCIDYLKKEEADVYGLQEVKCLTRFSKGT